MTLAVNPHCWPLTRQLPSFHTPHQAQSPFSPTHRHVHEGDTSLWHLLEFALALAKLHGATHGAHGVAATATL